MNKTPFGHGLRARLEQANTSAADPEPLVFVVEEAAGDDSGEPVWDES